mmetsp:Transcript_28816/g.65123  ORF Transcript_28816/g.65123 Transcript_28816/m.65123 type:complete len:231 (+) Transcript_28816:162-854(+)
MRDQHGPSLMELKGLCRVGDVSALDNQAHELDAHVTARHPPVDFVLGLGSWSLREQGRERRLDRSNVPVPLREVSGQYHAADQAAKPFVVCLPETLRDAVLVHQPQGLRDVHPFDGRVVSVGEGERVVDRFEKAGLHARMSNVVAERGNGQREARQGRQLITQAFPRHLSEHRDRRAHDFGPVKRSMVHVGLFEVRVLVCGLCCVQGGGKGLHRQLQWLQDVEAHVHSNK